ncbi:MAG TPA: Stf0 family sulfotransferase [Conexibacter sp.]
MTRPPDLAYVVCATPRSGSTLLCEMLRATGVAGNPREHFERLRHSGLPRQPREYLAGVGDPSVLELLAPLAPGRPDDEPAVAWRARIVDVGQTPNGVWGGKLMWGHVADLLARARALDGLGRADLADALRALLGDVRFVLVTRADTVSQAVSLWRAVQTRRWRADAGAPRRPHEAVYHFAAIDHLVAQLEADEAAWRAWFDALPTGPGLPLELSYETIDAEPRAAVERVLGCCGITHTPVGEPPLRHQRDAQSQEWVARYRVDKREAAA